MFSFNVVMAWNVFKFCTLLRGLGSVMILLVLSVVGFTYYAVVVTNYWPAVLAGGANSYSSVGILILFHILLVMLLWSYFSAVLTDPGSESGDPHVLTGLELSTPMLNLQHTASLVGSGIQKIRYCKKCNQLKPHAAIIVLLVSSLLLLFFTIFFLCGRCILKMDHHCVWVVNCVGALNYKFFLLFLFYTFLETTLVTIILLSNFIAFFNEGEIPASPESLATTFLTFVLNLAFALSVLGLLVMHLSLVAANITTIEAYEMKTTPKWRYDLGRRKNFEQVFGMDKRYWLIPAYTEEDLRRLQTLHGLDYPSKPELDSQHY
ncbi:hypothetical protein KFK09_028956 [Dendrobium nobile]|uniref:S-acyltransferase n=1 Tax=Dendrobium nobile TaxID=94219 RepID=A0A8T3A321_DENNO|nr:hypothetical protein KFK09_028956 [Dendrobium nobile]